MLVFLKKLASAIPTPAAGKVALFVDSTSGLPSYKTEAGTVTTLQGPAGQGVPTGGTANQVLAKIDGTNYNTQWVAGMTNPMTASGDLIYGGASGAPTRLAAGTNGYVLTLASGVPAWVAAPQPTLPINALTISSGVVNIDLSLGRHFTLTLSANVTSITFSNLPASGFAGEISVRIVQDATGGRTVALPSSFKATGGSDTSVATAANAVTLLTAMTFTQGTTWAYAMQDVAA